MFDSVASLYAGAGAMDWKNGTLSAFIVDTWGRDTLIALIRADGHILQVPGITELLLHKPHASSHVSTTPSGIPNTLDRIPDGKRRDVASRPVTRNARDDQAMLRSVLRCPRGGVWRGSS